MPPITAPAPSEVMGIHANCVNICRSRFAARSASDPDACAGCPGLQEFVGPDCATVFLDSIWTVAWHDGIVRMQIGHLLGGASEHLRNNVARAQHNADLLSQEAETQCLHAWPHAQRRWRAPRRVLSLPLRCVRFMRLAHGTPTRPPKVRAARSPLLPQALRCPLR